MFCDTSIFPRDKEKTAMKRFKEYALIPLLFFTLLAVVAVSVYGQQGLGRMRGRGARGETRQSYDPSQAIVISGEVSALKDIETKSGKMSGAGLELSTSDGTVLVFLGPHIYVDLQSFRIKAGDRVGIKGVRTTTEGRSIFTAGEVRKGDEVLTLLDSDGVPLWAGGGSRQGRGAWN